MNMMSEQTDRAVKRAAISNMMMPTGILVFRPVRAAIQPLARQRTEDNVSRAAGHAREAELQKAQKA